MSGRPVYQSSSPTMGETAMTLLEQIKRDYIRDELTDRVILRLIQRLKERQGEQLVESGMK